MQDTIVIRGAREHNLKNIDVEIPKNKLVVFTGLSGSGKSSLAFDTIYAEGQRRYVESLSSYARQFLGVMDKPDVDSIDGLSPAISIDQKSTSHNPRSTVGTVTEIYDYLRLLFARVGHPHCPNCGREIARQSAQQIVGSTLDLLKNSIRDGGSRPLRILIFSPVIRDRKGEFSQLFDSLLSKGYTSARIDGNIYNLVQDLVLIKTNKHTIEVVIDRISVDKKTFKDEKMQSLFKHRLMEAVEAATSLSEGLVIISYVKDASFEFPKNPKKMEDHLFSEKFSCAVCNISIPEIEPRIFSFNSPHGACTQCSGIGSLLRVDPDLILNKNLSITEGAILPFAKLIVSDTWAARTLLTVVSKIGIDARKALRYATQTQLSQLLYGTQDTAYAVEGVNRFGKLTTIYEEFPGIVNQLEKRYSETESDFVRMEIGKYLKDEMCPKCEGKRLKKEALAITIDGKPIVEITALSIRSALSWHQNLKSILNTREQAIAHLILKEIISRLSFLVSVGLDYLTLGRAATSLSGGEAQRIRLASQIGSGLSGVLYVLDEPSIGLHPRDNGQLIDTLKKLRDLGNTVVVVEHDREMMEHADHILDFGPGAGEHGGKIVSSGTVTHIKNDKNSLTGAYLVGRRKIMLSRHPDQGRRFDRVEGSLANASSVKLRDSSASLGMTTNQSRSNYLKLIDCRANNLKNITVSFPLQKFICVTGVSGSGKSTLVVDTLYQSLARHFNPFHREKVGKYTDIMGLAEIKRVILIDQSPIGRTPRSNPATYTGAFTFIRDIFSQLPESRARGFSPGRFSFNVKGGRCEACEGEGQTKIEMQFLPDVYVTCDVCRGTRFNSETLEVRFKEKNIAEILALTVEEALAFFSNQIPIESKLSTLFDVGLSYIHMGQPAPHLSGGEAQRVKLATELSKKGTRNTVYILDEPTTGLHFADLEKLLSVLHQLVSMGNTVVVIEHNLDVIKNADWIIDLGPEGGDAGGEVIAAGTMSDVMKSQKSYTGRFLKREL